MERASTIVEKIFAKQLQWKDLFAKHTFFTHGYKYYLGVIAASRSREAQLIWSGLVESKVRLLVTSLERVESIELAHPFIKGFDRVHRCQTEDEVDCILRGDMRFHRPDDAAVETTGPVNNDGPDDAVASNGVGPDPVLNDDGAPSKKESAHTIYTTTFYIGIDIVQGRVIISISLAGGRFLTSIVDGTKQLDLSSYTNEFKDICIGWAQFNPDLNSVSVALTRK